MHALTLDSSCFRRQCRSRKGIKQAMHLAAVAFLAVFFFPPCKGIQDSLGFRIPRRGFRIPSTGFQCLSVEFGTPIVSRIPDSTRKSFPDNQESGIRIPYKWQFVV